MKRKWKSEGRRGRRGSDVWLVGVLGSFAWFVGWFMFGWGNVFSFCEEVRVGFLFFFCDGSRGFFRFVFLVF